jgi:hypothetical protein
MYVCTGSCPEINRLKEIEIGMLVEVFIVDLVNKKKGEHENNKTNKNKEPFDSFHHDERYST